MKYDEQYASYQIAVEEALALRMDKLEAPEPLLSAMRYSLLAGGKRIRPVMLLAAYEMGGGDARAALPFACAVEMIHTYSLIHDDLPAMDDDDFRRGKPTNHKVYGEGMAILAGDGLLNLAYETMLGASETPAQFAAMRCIARGAGALGMVGGQCVDLHCEAERKGGEEELSYVHLHKTADMFIGAVTAGLALAGASEAELDAAERFAKALGIAFQIRDDLLDIEGDAGALGKQTGMDARHGKLTWPSVHGVFGAKQALSALTDEALACIAKLPGAEFLREMAKQLLSRDR